MTVSANPKYSYKQISASTNCNPASGEMGGIFVSAASATPLITIYDSASTTTTTKIVDTFIPVAATYYPIPASYANGLYVVISGTVSCTVLMA